MSNLPRLTIVEKTAYGAGQAAEGLKNSAFGVYLFFYYVQVFGLSGTCAGGVAGGYLTARLAPYRPMQHALALGVVGAVLGVAGAAAMWDLAPAWYSLTVIAIALPNAWLGVHGRTADIDRPMRLDAIVDDIVATLCSVSRKSTTWATRWVTPSRLNPKPDFDALLRKKTEMD